MHFDPLQIDLSNKYHCYMLGYFWADCYFGKDSKNKYRFVFEIKSSDFDFVWEILQTMGFKKFSERQRPNSKNPQKAVKAYSIHKLKFFKDYGFDLKNNRCEIYYALNEEMQKYFIKGFFDGDGTICLSKKNAFKVMCWGHYDQNWDFMKDFCQKNSIIYSLRKSTRKANHKSHKKSEHKISCFEITKKENKIKFCELINFQNIGLNRKNNVFLYYKAYMPKEFR